jgi:conjugal transfer pilus assembly protein TraF
LIKSVLLCFSLMCSSAAFSTEKNEFEKGWHFYDLPEEVIEEIEEKIRQEVKRQASVSGQEPDAGSSEWIKQNLPKVRQRAADNPTTENVRALLLLEKVLKDRGRRLARRATMVAQTDPMLDTSYKATSNSAMARARRVDVAGRKDELFQRMVDEGLVLWVFVQKACDNCDRAYASLARLTDAFGISILWIVDPGVEVPAVPESVKGHWEFRVGNGEARSMGVVSDFSIFAYNDKTEEYVLVSQGFIPFSSFVDRTILSADFAGWVTPAEVDSTLFAVDRFDLSEPPKGFSGSEDPVDYANFLYNQMLEGK